MYLGHVGMHEIATHAGFVLPDLEGTRVTTASGLFRAKMEVLDFSHHL